MVGWLLLFLVFFEPLSFTQETDTPAPPNEQAASAANQNEAEPQPEAPQAAAPQEEQAPAKPLPVIMAVEVRGNQIVSTNTILSKVRFVLL
jgi:hypothetical protein